MFPLFFKSILICLCLPIINASMKKKQQSYRVSHDAITSKVWVKKMKHIRKLVISKNKTEDPSVQDAKQGYVRINSKEP